MWVSMYMSVTPDVPAEIDCLLEKKGSMLRLSTDEVLRGLIFKIADEIKIGSTDLEKWRSVLSRVIGLLSDLLGRALQCCKAPHELQLQPKL